MRDEPLGVENVVTTVEREIALNGCASGIMRFKKGRANRLLSIC
jgi:hypothetical protein